MRAAGQVTRSGTRGMAQRWGVQGRTAGSRLAAGAGSRQPVARGVVRDWPPRRPLLLNRLDALQGRLARGGARPSRLPRLRLRSKAGTKVGRCAPQHRRQAQAGGRAGQALSLLINEPAAQQTRGSPPLLPPRALAGPAPCPAVGCGVRFRRSRRPAPLACRSRRPWFVCVFVWCVLVMPLLAVELGWRGRAACRRQRWAAAVSARQRQCALPAARRGPWRWHGLGNASLLPCRQPDEWRVAHRLTASGVWGGAASSPAAQARTGRLALAQTVSCTAEAQP